ncbi:uncharacterized protein LOC143460705 [Clavelina lepadiformis]|uniref:uncharacterized protein LOC143460705 n=1 Tax=Clavelina lepadiformis TaxID=159417 RepID=UPI0040434B75
MTVDKLYKVVTVNQALENLLQKDMRQLEVKQRRYLQNVTRLEKDMKQELKKKVDEKFKLKLESQVLRQDYKALAEKFGLKLTSEVTQGETDIQSSLQAALYTDGLLHGAGVQNRYNRQKDLCKRQKPKLLQRKDSSFMFTDSRRNSRSGGNDLKEVKGITKLGMEGNNRRLLSADRYDESNHNYKQHDNSDKIYRNRPSSPSETRTNVNSGSVPKAQDIKGINHSSIAEKTEQEEGRNKAIQQQIQPEAKNNANMKDGINRAAVNSMKVSFDFRNNEMQEINSPARPMSGRDSKKRILLNNLWRPTSEASSRARLENIPSPPLIAKSPVPNSVPQFFPLTVKLGFGKPSKGFVSAGARPKTSTTNQRRSYSLTSNQRNRPATRDGQNVLTPAVFESNRTEPLQKTVDASQASISSTQRRRSSIKLTRSKSIQPGMSAGTRLSIIKKQLNVQEKEYKMVMRGRRQLEENDIVTTKVWEFIGRRPVSVSGPGSRYANARARRSTISDVLSAKENSFLLSKIAEMSRPPNHSI